MDPWTSNDSAELYNIDRWSGGYFAIDKGGDVEVCPGGEQAAVRFSLPELVAQVRRRGIEPPVLLRFDGILRSRVQEVFAAFEGARKEYEYKAPYRCAFPIKVNQQHHLVDVLMGEGSTEQMGIEVGSKPELLAVMGLYANPGRLVICNGTKDRDYVELALLTSRLGAQVVLVIEKPSEWKTIHAASRALGIRPILGVRTKLSDRGAGRWKESGGDRSKFGLTTGQLVRLVDELQQAQMLNCLRLLHYHIGSQVTRIRSVKNALREATQTLVGLNQLGAAIDMFDVGGGLGVDYSGSQTDMDSSVNYTLREYALDVVAYLRDACGEAKMPEPTIISESGRALTAHHAVLVTEVLGVTDYSTVGIPEAAAAMEHDLIGNLAAISTDVTAENFLERYHDASEVREEAMALFGLGQFSLQERARLEDFYWRTCEKVLRLMRALDYVPDELAHLERNMADIYFLNFSLFQSLPDAWAIDQLFPILPIARHTEHPARRAILADITCDSDGKVDRFIGPRATKEVLELHTPSADEPYYLGFFLVGAYQEILGDMHNLFGDTNVVHVDQGPAPGPGGSPTTKPRLVHMVPGDRVDEVLGYVEYFRSDLITGLRRGMERALEENLMSEEESAGLMRRFESGLSGTTYLTPDQS